MDRRALLLGIALVSFWPFHLWGAELADTGIMEVASPDLVAGGEGELVLRYQAGGRGLPKGARVWIELPAGWYNQLGCPRAAKPALVLDSKIPPVYINLRFLMECAR